MALHCASVAARARGGWRVQRQMHRERGAKGEATSPQSPPGPDGSTSLHYNPHDSSPPGGKHANFVALIQSSAELLDVIRGHLQTKLQQNNNTNLGNIPKLKIFLQQQRYTINNHWTCKVFPAQASGRFMVTMQMTCFIQAQILKCVTFALKLKPKTIEYEVQYNLLRKT